MMDAAAVMDAAGLMDAAAAMGAAAVAVMDIAVVASSVADAWGWASWFPVQTS